VNLFHRLQWPRVYPSLVTMDLKLRYSLPRGSKNQRVTLRGRPKSERQNVNGRRDFAALLYENPRASRVR